MKEATTRRNNCLFPPLELRLFSMTCWARTWLSASICSRCRFSSFRLVGVLAPSRPASHEDKLLPFLLLLVVLLSCRFCLCNNNFKCITKHANMLVFLLVTTGVAEESASIRRMESAFFNLVLFSSGDFSSLCK